MQYQQISIRYKSLDFTSFRFNTLVRCHVDCRIKPHAPPFIQTPANLFKFDLCSFTPQARYFRVSWYTEIIFQHRIPIDSRYELLGSPILFDTRTLEVRRQIKIENCRGFRESI